MIVHSHLLTAQQRVMLRMIEVNQFCDPECDIDFGRAEIFKELSEIRSTDHIPKEQRFQHLIDLIEETVTDLRIILALVLFADRVLSLKKIYTPSNSFESKVERADKQNLLKYIEYQDATRNYETFKQFLPKIHFSP